MAETIAQITGSIKESIARTNLETGALTDPMDWTITLHFESATYDAQGAISPAAGTTFGSRVVSRRFGDVKDQTQTINGKTLSVAELAAFVKAFGYAFRAEDIAAETARMAAEQAPAA